MGRKGHGRYGKHSRRDRRKKKGGIISTVILIVAICVFAFSAFQLYKIFNGYHKGESEYNDLVKLAVTEDKGEQDGRSGWKQIFRGFRCTQTDQSGCGCMDPF